MVDLLQSVTQFEDLSNDIIISIIEYLSYDESITIFGTLNSRFSWIIFEHPWVHYQLNIQMMDNDTLQQKIAFLETIKLQLRIWTITLSSYSIYRSIDIFNQNSSISSFVNLQALRLINVTLQEVGFFILEKVHMCFDVVINDWDL